VAYARKKLRQWKQEAKAAWWADNMAKCSCDMCTAPHKKPLPKINLNEEFA
jgi:hypothetical protein